MILENKKKEEEELHKLEWASRNEKRAHWNKNRSKGKKALGFLDGNAENWHKAQQHYAAQIIHLFLIFAWLLFKSKCAKKAQIFVGWEYAN